MSDSWYELISTDQQEHAVKSIVLMMGVLLVTAAFDQMIRGHPGSMFVILLLALASFLFYEHLGSLQLNARLPIPDPIHSDEADPRDLRNFSKTEVTCVTCGQDFKTERAYRNHWNGSDHDWPEGWKSASQDGGTD